MVYKFEREIGESVLSIEVGKIAKQAHGAAVVTYGDTVVLGTVVTGPPRPGIDFFPLSVDYREKLSAAGRIPGGFFKREGRPSTNETLTMRMIDRPMRPMFPEGFMDEVQIQVMVLSADLQNIPDVIGFVAAAAAVEVSGLPFNGPVAAVRVGRINGQFIVNPNKAQLEHSDLDVVVAGHKTAINMIEVGSKEISEKDCYDAVKFGHENGVLPICEMLEALKEQAGKPVTWEKPESNEPFMDELKKKYWNELLAAKSIVGKQERNAAVKAVNEKAVAAYVPDETADDAAAKKSKVKAGMKLLEERLVRSRILNDGVRPDGRKLDQIRKIECEVGWLPRVHGSSLFSRGETQAMVTTTLGTPSDVQIIDDMMGEYKKRFMLHYNFPPFSVGEARRIGSPGRREIGHGALAERSLEAVMPSAEEFAYTVRLVSDILESNGSSSMATVCGGTLALMDAGVPIKAPVAGISIGLVEEGKKHVIFTDILGEEDGFGDMDFKVAGTRAGITGVQLDIKTHGIRFPILKEALEAARKARLHILDIMEESLGKPRPEISQFAPRMLTLKINTEKIGKVIGPGGKTIRAIQADTGAEIDIQDDGTVTISSTDSAAAKKAYEIVQRMTEEVAVGRVYEGKVISIKDFGAFVEITEGQDGLCHISELDDAYVKSVTDVVHIGDTVKVKVIAIDDQGRVKLSRKQAMREDGAA
ncbi:MAG: polyribonucleotide nucleotidyltransferase [Phycisphaerae bacterium]